MSYLGSAFPSFCFTWDGGLLPLGQGSCLPLEELKEFILTPVNLSQFSNRWLGAGLLATALAKPLQLLKLQNQGGPLMTNMEIMVSLTE